MHKHNRISGILAAVAATLALAAGCSSSDEPTSVTSSFSKARATSTHIGGQILTKMIAPESNMVVATAIWDATSRTGNVDAGDNHAAVKLGDTGELSLDDANAMAYETWISTGAGKQVFEGEAPPSSGCRATVCCERLPSLYPSYGSYSCAVNTD